jgi:hypothetical protein
MKLKNILLMASAASLVVGSANGAEIYITGATAFRSSVYAALNTAFDAGKTLNVPANIAVGAESGAGFRTWSGTIGGAQWNVFESYSGSVEGIQTLVEGTSNNFLPIDTANKTTFLHTCDIAFSDVFQDTTVYNSDLLIDLGPIGVQPFVIVRNANAGVAGVNNVTSKLMQQLLASANLPLKLFTGGTATTPVWLVGRDKWSGTRMTVHMDTDFVTVQCQLAYDNTTTSTWEKKTSPGIPEPGYGSGGNLVKALQKATYPAAIGYVSLGDYKNSGLDTVSYNGVTLGTGASINLDLVKNGQYSLWCYEHMYTTTASETAARAFNAVFGDKLSAVLLTSTTAIAIEQMKCKRSGDGAPISFRL